MNIDAVRARRRGSAFSARMEDRDRNDTGVVRAAGTGAIPQSIDSKVAFKSTMFIALKQCLGRGRVTGRAPRQKSREVQT